MKAALSLALLSLAALSRAQDATSTPTLDYKTLRMNSSDDLMPDFSFAGAYYSSQSLPDPTLPATMVVLSSNTTEDRTDDIQFAVDQLQPTGGIVQLGPGSFTLSSSTVQLYKSNVTLRGTVDKDGTLLTNITGKGAGRPLFTIGDPNAATGMVSKTVVAPILDKYVPVGTSKITVDDASYFMAGQQVRIQKSLSIGWVAAMGMDTLFRNGAPQTWIGRGAVAFEQRTLVKVDLTANILHFDVPLTDSIDATFNTNAQVMTWTPPSTRAVNVGLESLALQPAKDQTGGSVAIANELLSVVAFSDFSEDCWVRNIKASGFSHSVTTAKRSRRITIADFAMDRPSRTDKTAGSPADILVQGSMTLVLRCSTTGVQGSQSWNVATSSLAAGPNAVVQYNSTRPEHIVEPHQRWATGFLIDNSTVGGLGLMNRGIMGSGQGWAVGNAVGWNVKATGSITVQSPPYSSNFCAGCSADKFSKCDADALIMTGQQLQTASLFQAQLEDRIGKPTAATVLAPVSYVTAALGAPASSTSCSSSSPSSCAPASTSAAALSIGLDILPSLLAAPLHIAKRSLVPAPAPTRVVEDSDSDSAASSLSLSAMVSGTSLLAVLLLWGA